ncbi:MAG: hypothetical protein ACK4VO_07040 [Pseudobdellovibrio sp.]
MKAHGRTIFQRIWSIVYRFTQIYFKELEWSEIRMNSEHIRQLKPFCSVLFLVVTLFMMVFLKMEERRMSYVVLKQTREFKKNKELLKQKEFQLAKLTRPQLVETVAKEKLTLKRATQAQIIHLNPTVSLSYLNKEDQN